MTGWMWLFATVIGAAVLGFVIFYGWMRSTEAQRDRAAVQRREEATRKIYAEEERRYGE